MWLQFRFLPCKLLNLSKSSGIFLNLLLCQGNEITVRGIPADKKWTARASAAFYCVVLPYVRRVHKKSADIRKGFKIITYRTIMNSAQALQRRTPCRAALRFVFYFVA